jgi:hypothetical protein
VGWGNGVGEVGKGERIRRANASYPLALLLVNAPGKSKKNSSIKRRKQQQGETFLVGERR